WHGLALGIALNAAAFAVFAGLTNLLAALLALSGTLIYVFVYTLWLKRWTTQNIVIGGAAGAVPPLVGWAAVTGRLDLTAVSLAALDLAATGWTRRLYGYSSLYLAALFVLLMVGVAL